MNLVRKIQFVQATFSGSNPQAALDARITKEENRLDQYLSKEIQAQEAQWTNVQKQVSSIVQKISQIDPLEAAKIRLASAQNQTTSLESSNHHLLEYLNTKDAELRTREQELTALKTNLTVLTKTLKKAPSKHTYTAYQLGQFACAHATAAGKLQ